MWNLNIKNMLSEIGIFEDQKKDEDYKIIFA
jgi:hypothetical protein